MINFRNARGNAFIFVLMGIILFAALSFTIARSMRSETTSNMSARDATLAATDIVDYAMKLERAINRLRRKNTSENDISFDNNVVSGYTHGSAQPDSHKVFHTSGGNVTWLSPPANANDGSEFLFTGLSCVADVGTGATGCDSDSTSNEELIAVLPNLNQTVCEKINDKLGIGSIPNGTAGAYSTTKFVGTYTDGTEIISGITSNAACYQDGSDYHFYYVLIER